VQTKLKKIESIRYCLAAYGYDTLVYELISEFMPHENQLQIVLIEADYRGNNNYTPRTMRIMNG
jgi:hypothetical protein